MTIVQHFLFRQSKKSWQSLTKPGQEVKKPDIFAWMVTLLWGECEGFSENYIFIIFINRNIVFIISTIILNGCVWSAKMPVAGNHLNCFKPGEGWIWIFSFYTDNVQPFKSYIKDTLQIIEFYQRKGVLT